MMNLTKKSLPNTVRVGGRDFSIYTDYRIWLRFCIEFSNWQKSGMKNELDIKYLFKNELPTFYIPSDYDSILDFAFPKNVLPTSNDNDHGDQTLYFEYDGDYIYAAFFQQYGIDLVEVKDFHWHKFRALLNGITSPTKLYEIMGYRAYTGEKHKEDIYMKLKDAWTPPIEPTEEDIKAEKEFEDYFG